MYKSAGNRRIIDSFLHFCIIYLQNVEDFQRFVLYIKNAGNTLLYHMIYDKILSIWIKVVIR